MIEAEYHEKVKLKSLLFNETTSMIFLCKSVG
jgi:hypothetical protein